MTQQALIIDDNIKNVTILSRMLASEGLESIQVTDPALLGEVIEQVEGLEVVFLDLEMPHFNGYEVLKMFKSDARFESTPIIAYTVHVSEIREAHQQGFDGFLGKPLDSDKFPEQLARILAGKPVWETP